jgi:hypothetical protein
MTITRAKSKRRSPRKSKRQSPRKSKRQSPRKSKRRSPRKSRRKHRLIGGVLRQKITGISNHLPDEITSMIYQTMPLYSIDSLTGIVGEAQDTLQNLTILVRQIKTEQRQMDMIRQELFSSKKNQSTEIQLNTLQKFDRQVKDVLTIIKSRLTSLIKIM